LTGGETKVYFAEELLYRFCRTTAGPATGRKVSPASEVAVNAKLGQHLTLLGLCSLVFYAAMLGMGTLTIDVLPQFLISAIVFLSSGRLIKLSASRLMRDEADNTPPAAKITQQELDWPWLTGFLNWGAAFLVIGIMAIFLMKPIGITLDEALSQSRAPDHYFGSAIP
jgi:hypothetical protein